MLEGLLKNAEKPFVIQCEWELRASPSKEVAMRGMLIKTEAIAIAVSVFISLSTTASFAIDITECGYLSQANSTYVLQNDVSSEGTCFFITAENITLDLNGHTVTYDNAASTAIVNGDFETTEGWDLSSAPNAAFVEGAYVQPVTLYSGSQSLRISVPNVDQSIRSTLPLQLQPNTTYTLSAMIYNQVNDQVTMYVELAGTATRASKTGKTWRGFQYVSVEFTTGSNPNPVTVVAGIIGGSSGGAGSLYFDDIRIQRTRVAGVAVGPAQWQGQTIISDVIQYGSAKYATIRNGTIQQGQSKSDSSNCVTIMENSGTGWKLHDLTLRADGVSSRALYSINARNVEVYNNHIYNPQWAIVSRDQYDGAAIKIEYRGYGNKIYNNTIHEGVQTAFYMHQTTGEDQNEVSGNIIELQTRYTNDFAIWAGGAKVHDNTINCGSGNNSCRGIYTGGVGTLVYNNIINVQELPRNQEYNGCQANGAYGVQMESYTTGMNVYGNTVTAYAGECEAYAFRANPTAQDQMSSSNNAVHDNIFVAIADGTARAATIRYSKLTSTDVNVYNNIFRTNHRWIYIDGRGPVTNPSFSCNRWETTGILPSLFYPFEVNTWEDSHFSGTFYGNTYGPGDQERFESESFRLSNGNYDPYSNFMIASPPSIPANLKVVK